MDEWKYILAYSIFILLAIFMSKTRVGYTIIYYTLVLAILLLVVIEAPKIADALSPISGYQATDINLQVPQGATKG